MNPLHCLISSWVLLLCLAVSTCSDLSIVGFEGQDVTLPCKYDSNYHGGCHICWMRGNVPLTGCGDQILYANEKQVLARTSVRYLLNGDLQRGDAALTIRNARQTDNGKYSCRVHIPGWFNDKKFGVLLSVIKATPQTTTLGPVSTTTTTTLGPVSTTTTTTLGPVTTTTTSSLTHGPVSTQHHETTTNYPTTISETVTTNPGPVSTQHHETTANYPTTISETATTNTGPDSITNETETTVNVTTNNTVSGLDEPFKENTKSVKEATYLYPVIWASVCLILLVFGISSFYLICKHKRRLRSTLEIAKISSAFVSYNNFDDSVILPIDNEKPFKN